MRRRTRWSLSCSWIHSLQECRKPLFSSGAQGDPDAKSDRFLSFRQGHLLSFRRGLPLSSYNLLLSCFSHIRILNLRHPLPVALKYIERRQLRLNQYKQPNTEAEQHRENPSHDRMALKQHEEKIKCLFERKEGVAACPSDCVIDSINEQESLYEPATPCAQNNDKPSAHVDPPQLHRISEPENASEEASAQRIKVCWLSKVSNAIDGNVDACPHLQRVRYPFQNRGSFVLCYRERSATHWAGCEHMASHFFETLVADDLMAVLEFKEAT
jgi:hypothetical protein